MRVTGGAARGIRLQIPRSDLRPATDQSRERLFGWLGDWIVGRTVVDTFAGTGAYGLEALSRGARHVRFIEKDRKTVTVLRANVSQVERSIEGAGQRPGSTRIEAGDVLRLRSESSRADVVIADPPYPSLTGPVEPLWRALDGLLSREAGSVVVLEAPGDWQASALPEAWKPVREFSASAGQPSLRIFERKAVSPEPQPGREDRETA